MFVLGLLVMSGRVIYIQVIKHDHYVAEAASEHLQKREVRSSRGSILDRQGFPLVISRDTFDVWVDRRVWRNDVTIPNRIATALAPLAVMPQDVLMNMLLDTSKGPITMLVTGLEFEVGNDIDKMNLPGDVLAPATKRAYPEGDLGSAYLGFLGREHKGLAGLESTMDDTLSGKPGFLFFEQDGGGQPIAFGRNRIVPGTPGSDVRLTIDRYLQRLVETELDYQVKLHQASGGTIMIMDPMTGAILAMTSRPTFKLSELNLDNPDLSLLRERAITDLYEPGSVMKTITMAAAIDQGLVTPNTTYFDSGSVTKGGYEFKNWDFGANGTQTMTQVLQKSLNTGAIWVSDRLGATKLYDYLYRFGFGETTHSGLAGEADGLVRTNKADEWFPSDLATNSYGQGMAATPLQVITGISALVNGGNLMRPYIVAEIDGPEGTRKFDPVVVRHPISPEAAATMKKMLNDVVDGVPTHGAKVKGYNVGGKTGTTLVSIPTGYDLNSTIASFVGFAPVENPAFIMLVKIDQPKDDPLGGIVAAPVFGRLAPKILAYLNVKPTSGPGIAARPAATSTPVATSTPNATSTPKPTVTPAATATPVPAATATPTAR
jgi:cell division protein FtsI/penicillin-binding protein 2